MDQRQYDDLVVDIYRASARGMGWATPLDGIGGAFRLANVHLGFFEVPSGRLVAVEGTGTCREFESAALEFLRTRASAGSASEAPAAPTPQDWVHFHEHHESDHAATSRGRPVSRDMRYGYGLAIPLEDGTLAVLGMHRSHDVGPVDQETRIRLERIAVHLREAMLTGARVRELEARALAAHPLLSAFPYPMWLIDRNRFVRYANGAAQGVEASDDFVRRESGQLRFDCPEIERELTDRLRELGAATHDAVGVIDIRCDRGDGPNWLHLSVVDPTRISGVSGERAQVLATLLDASTVSALDPAALAATFRLSPTEARVAAYIAEGMSPEDIAVRHGTRVATVRTQLRGVFAKIGVSRQVEVVRMLRQGEALWSAVRRGSH